MLNIIKADLYRLLKSKGFYLYWIFVVATYALTIAIKQPGGIQVGGVSFIDSDNTLDIRQMSANVSFYYFMILQVFGVVTSDFSEKTIKNTISSAISRKKYFITKFIFTEIFVVASFVVANIVFYFANRVINNDKEYYTAFSNYMKLLVRQLPILIGACAAVVLVAFIVKKAATFNSITILFPILYPTILLIGFDPEKETIFSKLLKYEMSGQFGMVVSENSARYITNCTLLGFGVAIACFVIGYVTFTKYEIN